MEDLEYGAAMKARWWRDGVVMVAESCRRWRCDGDTRKTTLWLESWRRGSGRFEMLERDSGGSSPAGVQRLAAFRRELRWSDKVMAAMEVAAA